MKPTHKEIERQLSESRREFWAADATINNLELKLAEMAERLANAESKCRELAGNHTEQNLDMVDHFGDATQKDMLHGSEPVTDNTNQQFESLSRGDK